MTADHISRDPEAAAKEIERLNEQLDDLRAALNAIRDGEVDAVVVGGPQGEQLYTQINADRPYRVIVEEMGDGALTISERGIVLYANERMAQLLRQARAGLLGRMVNELVAAPDAPSFADLLGAQPGMTRRAELDLQGADGVTVPVLASVTGLEIDGVVVRCLIVADLTDQRRGAAAVSAAQRELLRQQVELAQEHRLMETLQRAVLPAKLPVGTGFRVAARYLPADQPSQVGGDWYDAFSLPNGTLALAVGDVVGHDLEAAATMGQMRNALRAYAFPDGAPADVLKRLNSLADGFTDSGLTTAIFGLLDITGETFRWAGAGHPPPLLIGEEGARLLLPQSVGMMLGADAATSFGEVLTPIRSGELLVLYTDGLIERRNSDLDADLSTLLSAADGLADHSPEDVCAALVERLVPAGHEDDVCLLVLELLGQDR